MCMNKEKHNLPFDSLHSGIDLLAHTLFPGTFFSVSILPLTYIDTQTKQISQYWLHEKEHSKLNSFSFIKRHREWLGGRICAKMSLCTFFQKHNRLLCLPKPHEYQIASEDSGRPYFFGLEEIDRSPPELSISHSKEFATALTSTVYCGIDIQYPAENLLKVKEQFCSDMEEQLLHNSLPDLPHLHQLSLLWSGKEAVKKMLSPDGIPGFREIHLQSSTPCDTSCAILHFSKTGGKTIPVAAGILNSTYALALCCETH